jgi:hypothetical protein
VASLATDMDTLLPPLARMAYADAQVQAAAKAVAARREAPPLALPAPQLLKAPVAPQAEVAPQAKKAPSGPGTKVLRARVGMHPGRTRLVLDLDGPMAHEEVLDEAEGVLLVTLPSAQGWAGPTQREAPQGAHIERYAATTGPSGTQVAIELRNNTKLLRTEALRPKKNRPHRLVFDFAEP